MFILNLTQHQSTPEQGCYDLQGRALADLKGLLTFDNLPTRQEIVDRANTLAAVAARTVVAFRDLDGNVLDHPATGCEEAIFASHAMIGGAPFLMGPLEAALRERGITPLYAFSVRESVDEVLPDGSIRKVAVFRHKGFIEA